MPTMWTPDRNIEEARRHSGWAVFHRECGKLNFYVDQIVKVGRTYRASSFRLRDRNAEPYIMFPMAEGVGKTVIAACLDAYRRAVASGHMADTHLETLFEDDNDLIGEPHPNESLSYKEQRLNIGVDDEEDLIG